jgi:hypothetical protein
MRGGEERKLLARAAGFFNHPGEADQIENQVNFAMILLSCTRELAALSAWLTTPIRSHQGEREKNEYSYDGKNTAELPKRT